MDAFFKLILLKGSPKFAYFQVFRALEIGVGYGFTAGKDNAQVPGAAVGPHIQ